MVAGVSGGLARYFDIHPAVYRVGFVVLTLLGGAGIIIYVAAALVIPDEGAEDSVVTRALRERRDRPWPLIGLGLLGIAVASLLSRATLWPHGGAWIALLIAGLAILWITRQSVAPADTAAAAASDARRVWRFFRGVLIAVVALIATVLVLAAVTVTALDVHLSNGIGDRTYIVGPGTVPQDSYKLGIGDMTVDLRNANLTRGTNRVDTRVDLGKLTVIVPADAPVRVTAEGEYGEVRVFGDEQDGHNAQIIRRPGTLPVLDLHAHVGAGQVVIRHALR
jgi:phage shock protein PspC (stress-responsive transcriptional regulator)